MTRLPWYGRCAPHAILDILRGCNCRCRNCYNGQGVRSCKSLSELKSELEVVRRARNVTTITLSGGEPLLHPEVLRIVSWLSHDCGLKVCTLTNGILFDAATAGRLKAAGLDLVTLHIQEGQVRPDLAAGGVDALRREKGRIARASGIFPALISTLEARDGKAFEEIAAFLRTAPEYEYVLVTVARDFAALDPMREEPELDRGPMLSALAKKGFVPTAFVGGDADPDCPRWYVFQSVQAVDRSGRERAWNRTRMGWLERAFLHLYAKLFGRSFHWVRSTSAKLKCRLLLNGLTGGFLSTLGFAVRAVLCGWAVSEKHIIVQFPPRSLGGGRVEFCLSCPDATVRNGRLQPLCLHDVEVEVTV